MMMMMNSSPDIENGWILSGHTSYIQLFCFYVLLAVDELVDITSTALVCTFVCSITSDFEGIQTLLFLFSKM
jgi:hypothetical protein